MRPKCDAHGNIYLCPYSDGLIVDVVKLGPDGKRVATYTFRQIGDLKGTVVSASDFQVDAAGHLYAFVVTRPEGRSSDDHTVNEYLVRYKPDGQYDSATQLSLPEDYEATGFVRFATGELLIVGMLTKDSSPRTLVVDTHGAVVQPVEMNERFRRDQAGRVERAEALAINLTLMTTADDGNVYIVRPTAHPTVFVISPTGEILRELALDTPPSSQYNLDDIGVGKGRIALAFTENKAPVEGSIAQHLFRTYDALTGELQSEYEPSKDLWGMFSCYVPPSEFILLTPQEKTNTFLLQRATP